MPVLSRTLKFCTIGLLLAAPLYSQKPAGAYYVGANAGLNLRATAAAAGERLAAVPYAEKVEIVEPAADQSMAVDGIQGGMARVKYGGKTGYLFDGYLLAFPPPAKGEQTADYASRLRTTGADVMHEELRRDWGGYAQFTHALYFKKTAWDEAFLLAKNLYGIPAPLTFPGDKGGGVSVMKNPNAPSTAWTDELQATYGSDGKLQKVVYSFRGEGGGQAISIEPSTEITGYSMKISQLLIAD